MATIWLTWIAAQYRAILEDLAIALRTCPDELWEESLYPVDASDPEAWTPIDPDGRRFEDEAVTERKRRSQGAVWRTASHTLFFTDADLSAMEQHRAEWACLRIQFPMPMPHAPQLYVAIVAQGSRGGRSRDVCSTSRRVPCTLPLRPMRREK